MPKHADVPAHSAGFRRDHGRGTKRLNFPVKKLAVKLLGFRGIAAPDFKMDDRPSHKMLLPAPSNRVGAKESATGPGILHSSSRRFVFRPQVKQQAQVLLRTRRF